MADAIDRARCIFGNEISEKDYAAALKAKAGFAKRFGDDADAHWVLEPAELPVIGEALGVRNLVMAGPGASAPDLGADAAAHAPADAGRPLEGVQGAPVAIANIRMGFGHYRIAMAMASAAHAMGLVPYWLDLCSFPETVCSKVISHQNKLYSMGSRLSQKLAPFNALYWEPLNSEGFRKLSYNASDQKVSELMAPVLESLPRDIAYVGTHVWPAQAAVHAGLTHVVNAIPDNWPMALHLAEGSIHAIQTPGAYLGYKQLRGMDPARQLKPMPDDAIRCTGHFIDHELVVGIGPDCAARRERVLGGGPVRYLLTVGGAGAQAKLFADIVGHLLPYVDRGEAVLLINVGDHEKVWRQLERQVKGLKGRAQEHFGDFAEAARFAEEARTGELEGIHAFCDSDIFAAVYATNLLMRACDVLVTKPSELAYYPVPKLMIHRVGGHEAWGAIRAAELGDGTYEIDDTEELLAMIDSLQADRTIVAFMCDNIERAAAAGIYDGAYEVVRLAVEGV